MSYPKGRYDPPKGEDDFSSSSAPQAGASSDYTDNLQRQIDDTANIMHKNLQSLNQAGPDMSTLHSKTTNLRNTTGNLNKGSGSLLSALRRKDLQYKIWVAVALAVLIVIIVVPIVVTTKKSTP